MSNTSTDAFNFPPIAYFVRDEFPFVRSCMDEVYRRLAPEPMPLPAQVPELLPRGKYFLTCPVCRALFRGGNRARRRVKAGGEACCSEACKGAYRTVKSRSHRTLTCDWYECRATFVGTLDQVSHAAQGRRVFCSARHATLHNAFFKHHAAQE